jgi:hypothetical protein
MSEAELESTEMPEEYTKAAKSTKSKSFVRRAIGYLPTVASGALTVANAANAAGFVHNPQLRAALETANAIKKYVPFAKGVYSAVRGAKSSSDAALNLASIAANGNKHAPVIQGAIRVMRAQRHSLRR